MSIIEEYPGTIAVVRRYVDLKLSRDAMKRMLGRSVSWAELDLMLAAIREERAVAARKVIVRRASELPAEEPVVEPATADEAPTTDEHPETLDAAGISARLIEIEHQIEDLKNEAAGIGSPVLLMDIVADICKRERISIREMLSQGRHARLVRARQEIMYLGAKLTHLSLPTMGRLLHRDHTSVLHGIRKHAARNGLPLPRGMTFSARRREVGTKCGEDVSSRFYGDFSASDMADPARVTG